MQRFLLGFSGGALTLGLPWPGGPALPAQLAVSAAAAALGALLLGWQGRLPGLALVLGICGGLAWSGFVHHQALVTRLPDSGGGDAMTFRARVITTPAAVATAPGQPPGVRFQVRVMPGSEGAAATAGPARLTAGTVVRLSWYGAGDVRRQDVWDFSASLKAPWSYANPAGFDYERWLLGAGIQATGYVRTGSRVSRPPSARLARLRQRLAADLAASGLARRGILAALLLGESGGIGDDWWDMFRATGTVHLMVISGLHVSLAAALGVLLGRVLGRLIPLLPLMLDVRRSGCLAGLAAAAGYVALSGAGVPALRALVMTAAGLWLLARGRTANPGAAWLLALAGILAVDPLSVHRQGLWLSFAAVLVLLVVLGSRTASGGAFSAVLRAQLALGLGMLPLVVLATGSLPWIGVPANLVAVPAVSLLVVPATLLGGALAPIWPDAAALAWLAADAVLGAVLHWLHWLARAPAPAVATGAAGLLVAQAAAAAWLFAVPRRYLAVLSLALIPPLTPSRPDLAPGHYRVTALDVGQGTAVLVETRRHRLLYDTGPAFPSGFDTGRAVVVPNLLSEARRGLDALVLSHDDLDHTGGSGHVLERMVVGHMLSPPSVRRRGHAGVSWSHCNGGRWRWDEVDFRLLALPRPVAAGDNDRSCVLLVDNGRHRVLLAGDLSRRLEPALLRAVGKPVHLMFAPHHGSRTSSSRALVRVLAPSLVLVNAARGNRFGHPHPEVVERYRAVGARLYQTGLMGRLVWRSDQPERVEQWRAERAPYWRGRR